jgi:hypothetical protein
MKGVSEPFAAGVLPPSSAKEEVLDSIETRGLDVSDTTSSSRVAVREASRRPGATVCTCLLALWLWTNRPFSKVPLAVHCDAASPKVASFRNSSDAGAGPPSPAMSSLSEKGISRAIGSSFHRSKG